MSVPAPQDISAPIRIARVRGAKALNLFIEVAYRIRGVETHWVPPLRRDMRTLLDRDKHPFHQHAAVEYFLAFREGRCVGRIAAIENYAHNQFHNENIGFFGFLDAEPQPDVFKALLRAAERWAKGRRLTALRGPCSFSTNEECGLLVEGFDSLPVLMTPWNPPNYPTFVEAAGYTKAKDLWQWWMNEATYNERIGRLAEKLLEKLRAKEGSVVLRHLRIEEFEAELARFQKVYNSAWEKNWGFIPMTAAEIEFMARELKPVLIPEYVQFVEVNGEPVGAALTMPDYNVVLRHLEGKLGPKQIALFLMLKKQIKAIRVMALGVRADFRNRGLESLLVHETIKAARARGAWAAEMGWILEDNAPMNRILEACGARHYKTHRIYEKQLA